MSHLQVFCSALGRTRTCGLLIRRPNRAVLSGSLRRALAVYMALSVPWRICLFYPVPVTLPSRMAPGISIGYSRATHGRTSSHGSSASRACATSRGRGEGQARCRCITVRQYLVSQRARLGDESARKVLKLLLPFRTPVRLTCVHAAVTRPQARRPLLTGSAVFAHNRYPYSCRRSCT
jgi:hypothetical protein